jgi:hypothetical protein
MTTSNPASDHKKKSRQLVAVCLTERGQDGQPGSKKEREREQENHSSSRFRTRTENIGESEEEKRT